MRKKLVSLFLGICMVAGICISGCGGNSEYNVYSDEEHSTESAGILQEAEVNKNEDKGDRSVDISESAVLSMEEAQRDKKLIAYSSDSVHFLYNNVLYGIPYWERIARDISALNNNAIVQMESRVDDVIFLDEKGRVMTTEIYEVIDTVESTNVAFEAEGEKDGISLGEVKYVYFKRGLQGDRDIYALLKDGRCLVANDYDWSRLQELFVGEDVVSMEYMGRDEYGVERIFVLLKENGTVEFIIPAGKKEDCQYFTTHGGMDVSSWSDIKCIVEGGNWMVGLKVDGSLVATGEGYPNDILEWRDIVDIQYAHVYSPEEEGIIGLKNDRTLVCSANLGDIGEEIQDWKNIKMMTCWGDGVAAVSNDGYFYRSKKGGHMPFCFDVVYEYIDGEYIKKNVEKDIGDENPISLDY